jgi:hypothetical protein
VSASQALIALLEQPSAHDPGVREVTQAMRRAPQTISEQFDHYHSLVMAVGAEQAACVVVNAARHAHRRWLAG